MFVNVYYLRKTIVAAIHLGLALSLISSLLWELIAGWNWLIVGAIAVISLYRIRRYFIWVMSSPRLDYISQRFAKGRLGVGAEINNFKLYRKYVEATDYWAITISAIALTIMTLGYLDVAIDNNTLNISAGHLLITSILIGGAILSRYRSQPQENALLTNQTDNSEIVIYTLAWIVELAVFSLIIGVGGEKIAIATANIILGLFSLWLIPKLIPIAQIGTVDRLSRRSSVTHSDEQEIISAPWGRLANLSQISLLYAELGIAWRLSYFNSYTGLLTLGAALIGIGVGTYSHQRNQTLNYVSLAGISLGIYEFVIYQMSRSPGGNIADGFTILSLVAAAIAFSYRLTAWWRRKQNRQFLFNLNLKKIIIIAHIHWAISSILKIIAAGIAIETATPRLSIISITVSFLLGAYALIQGRDTTIEDTQSNKPANDWWVYVGLVEIAATIVYSRLIIDKLSLFDPWRVIFTCAIALIIYQIPWHNFGWRSTPWQRTALVIPALMTLVTAEEISYLSLLITAVFYLRIAYYQRNIRWSYISLGFINWGVLRFIWQYNTEAIWFAAILSLSIFYIAQFDPDIQANRKQRHHPR